MYQLADPETEWGKGARERKKVLYNSEVLGTRRQSHSEKN